MNSNPTSKRLKTETLTDVKKGSGTGDDIAVSALGGSEVTTSEDVVVPVVNIFTDDILPEILNNIGILNSKDLLNFRLVNRCWRDVATSVLLKCNTCQIVLNFGKLSTDDDGNGNEVCEEVQPEHWMHEHLKERLGDSPASYKYFNAKQPRSFLSDLNQLISTSPKFPSTSIRFQSDCGWRYFHPPSEWPHAFPHQTDLLQFFSLYGKEIRKLSLRNRISKKALQNLLYVHMPHLLCLDFNDLFDFESEHGTQDRGEVQVCLPPPSTLGIKEIVVGTDEVFTVKKNNFLKELVCVSPNLTTIHSVGEAALGELINIEKSHLIQDLKYGPRFRQFGTIKRFTTLLTSTILESKLPHLQLSKFNVYLGNIQRDGFIWKAINVILSASKDCLKFLQLNMQSSRDILNFFIPPLPRLEYLKFNDILGGSSTGKRFHFLGDVVGEAIQSGELTADEDGFDSSDALTLQNQEGSKNIPADYFPRLRKIKIDSRQIKNDSNKLMGFFSLEHLGPDGAARVPGDILSTVTTLELTVPIDDPNIPKLFPNVSHLKFACESSSYLRNWIWTAFPKLERFELCTFNWDDDWKAEMVDCFFTGISQDVCANFDIGSSSSGLESDVKEDFERTLPFIGDCENLKELTINFWGKLSSMFASKLTAVRGFQEVIHRIKIILSFEGGEMSVEEIEETLRNLDPVAAYTEIRMKK